MITPRCCFCLDGIKGKTGCLVCLDGTTWVYLDASKKIVYLRNTTRNPFIYDDFGMTIIVLVME